MVVVQACVAAHFHDQCSICKTSFVPGQCQAKIVCDW